MDCAELRDVLIKGQDPNDAEVSAHVASCAACAELVADGGWLAGQLRKGVGPAPVRGLDELFASVQGAVRAERGVSAWLRSRPTQARIGLALGAAALLAVGELGVGPRPDLAVYPMPALLFEVGLYGVVLGLVTLAALRPLQRRPMSFGARALVVALALGVPVLLAFLAPAHTAHAASLEGAGDELIPRALRCFVFGGALGALLIALLRALDRGAHGAVGVVLIAAPLAGLTANLTLHLHCPITHPGHLFAGHVTVGFALLFAYGALAHVLARR